MKVVIACLLLLGLSGCVDHQADRAEQLANHKPFKIAEVDGVTVWKVRDSTVGGYSWIYFTSPPNHLLHR